MIQQIAARHPRGYDRLAAARGVGRHLLGAATDHFLELRQADRERIFNLGYFTWVEQQGVTLDDFVARRDQAFWRRLRDLPAVWDERIAQFNADVAGG